jgi:ankyrin repeat protein
MSILSTREQALLRPDMYIGSIISRQEKVHIAVKYHDVNDREVINNENSKEGKNISPLMIATARQNYSDVNLLLDHQAKVDIGGVPPLLIAIKNNDAQMIEILSRAGAYSDHHPALNEVGLIEYAIKNNIATECLECLLNENSGKINLTSQQILILLIN